jgi:NAD(P)-dependent dehydrogenase (short-subunit alcohol dehydrogenase family)
MANHTVIVTGGSSGIGRAICEHYLAINYRVLNLARRPLAIESPNLHNFSIDLSDRHATAALASTICASYNVDTLVHNAGLIRSAPIDEVQLDDLDYLCNVHLATGITLLQACLPNMKQQGYGRVVLIATRAVQGMHGRTNYAATKAAMIAQARTWAIELGGLGITVNSVAPGPIQATEMFHKVFAEGDPKIDSIGRSLPVGRVGSPDDVARAVLFFSSEENQFITGQNLFVCGGASLGGLSLS